MVFKKELSFGMLKIHGVQIGESKDISKFKEELICVQLLNAILTLLLMFSTISKQFKIN
jgi:hypothetical protein